MNASPKQMTAIFLKIKFLAVWQKWFACVILTAMIAYPNPNRRMKIMANLIFPFNYISILCLYAAVIILWATGAVK